MDTKELLAIAKEGALRGGEEILKVYNTEDFEVDMKSDSSPLTKADKLAHIAISKVLEATGLPILSEEGKQLSFEERSKWKKFWMVDPLDGTKEFIKRNGEFTVNIALIENGKPVLGVVYVPVTKDLYYNDESNAYVERNGEVKIISCSEKSLNDVGLKVVASRSHLNQETENLISSLKEPVTVSKGSSLKFLLVAEGEADIYPRFAPTMEWDTAAAHAIVLKSGKKVTHSDYKTDLVYNKEDLLNPHFIVH